MTTTDETALTPTQREARETLPPGLALDESIAERVMGWRRHGTHWLEPLPVEVRDIPETAPLYHGDELPSYSRDVAAAWLVVERMRALGWRYEFGIAMEGDDHWAIFWQWKGGRYFTEAGRAPTPAHAICLAALKALEAANA